MKYWWITANPDDEGHWSWINNCKIGISEKWGMTTEKDKTKKYALQLEEGDLVFGYNSGSEKELVALARITKKSYKNEEEKLSAEITKIKELEKPISLEEVKRNPFLKEEFSKKGKLNGTIIELKMQEFDELLRMI